MMAPDASATLPGSNLRWYLNRLRCMEPAEIPYRVRRALACRVEGMRPRRSHVPPPDITAAGAIWICSHPEVTAQPYVEAADQIARGRLDVFALRGADLGTPPRWNRDPKSGIDAPLAFGKLLDYRNPRLVGDIKYLWEPNRHLQFVTLAQAWALSGDPRHAEALFAQLDSWLAACPCGKGPNWSSALEPAIRLINWSLAWQILGGAQSPAFASDRGRQVRTRWLQSVFEHISFVRSFHSFHSSANNHLIGEAAGVFVASLTWPYWKPARAWAEAAREILVREAQLQNAPDGVNREQAVCYQQFELDLLLASWLAGRAAGVEFPQSFVNRIEAMFGFLAAIMDCGGNVPMFGDSDDGRAMHLSQEPGFCPYRSLLATGAVLFNRADLKACAGGLDDKTRWLLGAEADARFHALPGNAARAPSRRAFVDGGYFVLGSDFGTGREVRLVVDAGPLGYGSLAAHGHADALSFTLSAGGHELLVDPGTCTYRPDSPWRAFFRSTAAHNTLRIDGQDQSEAGGSFLWLSKANAACSHWQSTPAEDRFEGWQDGYMRLPDPVMHRRRITLHKVQRRVEVEDVLETTGMHFVELFFHFAEQCEVARVEHGVMVTRDGARALLRLPEVQGAAVQVIRGQESPRLGWVSRRFDELAPCSTVVWSTWIGSHTRLRTRIEF
jgi:hypothetical protein